MKNSITPIRPETIALEILYGCNLYCKYCYIGTLKNHDKPFIPSVSSMKSIIQRIRENQISNIFLVGGEPTLHPDFIQLIQFIDEIGFKEKGLVTNGTLITSKLAHELAKRHFYVNITIRADQDDLFNDMTGSKGLFSASFKGMQLLSKMEIPLRIEFDCTKLNYKHLNNSIEAVFNNGISPKEVLLHRISPYGDAAINSNFQLNIEQYYGVFSQVKDISKQFGIKIYFEDAFPLCLIEKQYWDFVMPCECGFGLLTIDPFGNARRCACADIILGNVLVQPFLEVWQNGLKDFWDMNWQPESCQVCSLFQRCRGGCSVSATFSKGYGPDVFSDHFHPF